MTSDLSISLISQATKEEFQTICDGLDAYNQQFAPPNGQEPLRRGCRHAHLDTFTFQALGFYEKHGYSVWGALDDLPPGFTRYFLRKDLQ